MFIRVVRAIVCAWFAVFHPLRVSGRERIPRQGAFILALNHLSFRDAFTAFLLMPDDAKYMAKKELFKFGPLRWFIRKIGAFPVDRENNDLSALRTALKALKEGHPLVIFPEGHRYSDGQIHEIRQGASFIALRSGVPVIPARIRTRYRPFCKVQISVGEPIPAEGKTDSEGLREYTEKIRLALESI